MKVSDMSERSVEFCGKTTSKPLSVELCRRADGTCSNEENASLRSSLFRHEQHATQILVTIAENVRLRGQKTNVALIGLGLVIALCTTAIADDFPKPVNTQKEGEHPPSPREMLDLFELPDGFNVTLFAGEPDVQQPIAFDFDDRGRIWVAENYTYSARGKVDQVMRDRVIILHDKDGDGEHDERKVFWDKGRMLTGLTWGYGGLWILNDGTLSFIPDKDGDDVPDSEPVEMLNGWTKGAGHNVVNGLLWGPDGWLYGRHGITDTSLPGTIDTPKEERQPMNCGIWRFHPVKHTFEIVCHGTTNPWGLDYNEVGDMFMSNNVIGHLWHVIPGAHYQRMFGQDFNPHCYELMGPISDHYHWDDTGKWNESRDGKADHLGGGHSHCGLMLYYGQNFPKEYWGKAFMCNTHGRCVNVDRIERKGSSYVAKHEPNFLKVNTPWFRGVQLAYGPAGCVYLSDWSDNGECHDHDGVHRTSGRIYRISFGQKRTLDFKPLLSRNLWQLTDEALEGSDGTWHKRRAQRIAFERFQKSTEYEKEQSVLDVVEKAEKGYINHTHLQGLHLLAETSSLTTAQLTWLILARDEYVRAFAVRHVIEHPEKYSEMAPLFESWLNHETSPAVLMEYASGLQRFSFTPKERLGIATAIHFAGMPGVNRKIIDDDHNLTLMFWYGLERWFQRRPSSLGGLSMLTPKLTEFRARRFASEWSTQAKAIDYIVRSMAEQYQSARRGWTNRSGYRLRSHATLRGLRDGLKGQLRFSAPPSWEFLTREVTALNDAPTLQLINEVSALFGDKKTLAKLREILSDRSGDHTARNQAVQSLTEARDDESVSLFLKLLNDRAVYVSIAAALANFDDPRIPKELLKRWDSLRHGAKEAATDTLCSRRSYAVHLARALKDGRVSADQLTASHVRQLLSFNVHAISKTVEEKWGVINATPEALEASIAKWKKELTDDVLAKADLENGAALFKKSCANCHKLYGEGGKIGPDLTGGNRANMDYLLGNVINPSGEVPKQFTMSTIALESGRLVNGVVIAETANTITVQTDKEQKVIAVSDIAERVRTSKSLMPDGLLDSLTPDQVRDLIAFVRHRR